MLKRLPPLSVPPFWIRSVPEPESPTNVNSAAAPAFPTTAIFGRLLFAIWMSSWESGTPTVQLAELNQSLDTAPVQSLACPGEAESATSPAIAVVPRRRARPALARSDFVSKSNDRSDLDNIAMAKAAFRSYAVGLLNPPDNVPHFGSGLTEWN